MINVAELYSVFMCRLQWTILIEGLKLFPNRQSHLIGQLKFPMWGRNCYIILVFVITLILKYMIMFMEPPISCFQCRCISSVTKLASYATNTIMRNKLIISIQLILVYCRLWFRKLAQTKLISVSSFDDGLCFADFDINFGYFRLILQKNSYLFQIIMCWYLFNAKLLTSLSTFSYLSTQNS